MVVGRPTDTLEDETLARTQPRFSDAQRAVLEALGERTGWSLLALAADEMQAFCQQNSIRKARSFPRPLSLAACCTGASPFHTYMDRYVPCEYRHSEGGDGGARCSPAPFRICCNNACHVCAQAALKKYFKRNNPKAPRRSARLASAGTDGRPDSGGALASVAAEAAGTGM